MLPSVLPEYKYQCLSCDEDLYGVEVYQAEEIKFKEIFTALEQIDDVMSGYGVYDELDNVVEDELADKFDKFLNSLNEDDRKAFLSILGTTKGMVEIAEQAGHDCL